jgi:hypothetical protein
MATSTELDHLVGVQLLTRARLSADLTLFTQTAVDWAASSSSTNPTVAPSHTCCLRQKTVTTAKQRTPVAMKDQALYLGCDVWSWSR